MTASPKQPTDGNDQSAAPASGSGSVLRAHVALGFAQVSFGLFPLFGKWALRGPEAGAVGFEPSVLACWRVAFGAIVFFAIALAVHGRRAIPKWRDLFVLQVCALLGIAVNQWLYLEGLERSTSINTGVLMMLVPLFTFVFAVLVRQERFEARRGIGIAVALVGASMLILQKGPPELSGEFLLGNLLLVGNTSCYAAYLVVSKPLMARYPPFTVVAWVYILSFWTILFVQPSAAQWAPPNLEASHWWALGLILLLPTSMAYLLNMYALQRVRASTTAVYVFSQPLIAALAGTLILGEALGPWAAAASAFIFVGIGLVVSRRRVRPAPA